MSCTVGDSEAWRYSEWKGGWDRPHMAPSTPQDYVLSARGCTPLLTLPTCFSLSLSYSLVSPSPLYPGVSTSPSSLTPSLVPPTMDSGAAAPATKPRRQGSGSGQTAKKRELDRIAQKKSRERARNRMAELEEKIRRLQADDKQKQISELMRVIENLRIDNERLRGMTEKIRSLTESVGPAFKGTLPP